MKKVLILAITVFMLFNVVACSGGEETSQGEIQEESTEQVVAEEEQVNEEESDNEEVFESEVGKNTIINSKKDLDLIQESGPFTVKLTDVQISDFEPSEDYMDLFDGKDKLTAITLAIEVENKSENTNSIYPDQGTITTNTKEQVQAEMFLSDEVGGDFIGEIQKKGEVFFFLDSPAEEIKEIKYIIDSGHDEEFESFNEDITFEIKF